VTLRKTGCIVLLFLSIVIADAWLFHSMWNLVQEKTEDVLAAVTADMVYFPVPKSSYDTK